MLLVASETFLFGVPIGCAIALLVGFAVANDSGCSHALAHVQLDGLVKIAGLWQQSSLSLVATDLLLMTGLLSLVILHATYGSEMARVSVCLSLLLACAGLFVVLTLTEYTHAYYMIVSSGSSMMFFVVTGLHGLHVTGGMFLICVFWLCQHANWVHAGGDMSAQGGVIGVMLYWHFVDCV